MNQNFLEGTNIYYFSIIIIIPMLIGLYGNYRCNNIKTHKDVLGWEIFNGSSKYGLDGWSSSHFMYFLIIGYYYPKTFALSMILGIIWELFETYIGYYKPKILQNYGFCKSSSKMSKQKSNIWWYGKPSDIIVNGLGFISGQYLSGY